MSAGLVARARELSERIDALNPRFQAFSHRAPDLLRQAERLEALPAAGGKPLPLHGVGVTLKGCIPVEGWPWTEGAALFRARVAAADAAIVTRLRAAGALLLGATTLSELAMYAPDNPFEPMGLNPWDPERTAGGSSTGAGVAAALGLGEVHLGTDSGGSVRNPACHCGVVGFMPSRGRLPPEGLIERTPSLTSVGLIARDVATVARAYAVLAEVPSLEQQPPLHLLVPEELIEAACDDGTRTLFEAATDRLRAAGVRLDVGVIDGWQDGEAGAGVVSLYEAAGALQPFEEADLSPRLQARRRAGLALAPEALVTARLARARFALALDDALRASGAAAVLTPTWPFAAPPIHAETVQVHGRDRPIDPHRNLFVRAANAADAAALTLPAGRYPGLGVPFGVQLMAPRGRDAALLRLALDIEPHLDHPGTPPLVTSANPISRNTPP